MAVSEMLTLMLAWAAGTGLGAVFFGGLWWTVRKAVSSRQPALWLFVSLLLRMGTALAGFYVVSGAQWQRLTACLVGFVMARQAVMWLTRPIEERHTRPAEEVCPAPQP